MKFYHKSKNDGILIYPQPEIQETFPCKARQVKESREIGPEPGKANHYNPVLECRVYFLPPFG